METETRQLLIGPLPEKLKSLRRQAKLSQEALADLVEITPAHYSMIERGKVCPSWDLAKRILLTLLERIESSQ